MSQRAASPGGVNRRAINPRAINPRAISAWLRAAVLVAPLVAGLACEAAEGAPISASIRDDQPRSDPSSGDPAVGEQLYSRCVACHALTYDRTGPRHCGLLGRRAGAVEGFTYSPAMKDSTVVWTAANLDRFIANPMKAIPGTAMGYAGVTDPRERADLIAYLAQAGESAQCRR